MTVTSEMVGMVAILLHDCQMIRMAVISEMVKMIVKWPEWIRNG